MARRWTFGICLVLSLGLRASIGGAAETAELNPTQQKFLDDVEWIMSPEERAAFATLTTDERRNAFIEVFWKQRDPTPATDQNEFRDEHYRRLRYADDMLGKGTVKRGSKTARGRIHILLGKPLYITHEDRGKTWPLELWYYQGLNLPRIPSSLYVTFYKPRETGDYQLYSPISDGPQALLRRETYRALDNAGAFQVLDQLDTELGRASLSLDAAAHVDSTNFSPSIDEVTPAIAQLPERQTTPGYVQRFLEGREDVELDYTFTYVPLQSAVWVSSSAGFQFLAYALQLDPRDISVAQYEDRYVVRFELDGTLEDEHGKTVASITDHLEFGLKAAEFQAVAARPMQIQGRHVVAPGTYKLTMILRNVTSRQYGRFEETVRVPEPDRWGPVMLAYRTEGSPGARLEGQRPFDDGWLRASPWCGNRVFVGAPVTLVARAPGVTTEATVVLDEGGANQSWPVTASDGLLVFPLPRQVLSAGDHRISIRSRTSASISGAASSGKSESKSLSNGEAGAGVAELAFKIEPGAWAEPWRASGKLTGADGTEVLLQEAELLERTGRTDLAIAHVKQRAGGRERPEPALQLALASLYLKSRRYDDARGLAEPEVGQLRYRKPEPGTDVWFRILAFAQAGLGRPADAAKTLGEALDRSVPSPELLNQQARWYRDAKDLENARKAYQRSLEIESSQPEVQKELNALR